ncbi:hypothetical protein [Sorangium sp. So ce887]|uniref:hypothetical protein n=1 Tax=Sorangium sp. So ce887 TaxID=3133324 RepID=UPI003F60780C
MTSRPAALRVLAALRQTPVGDDAVLVGSSGLFGFEADVVRLLGTIEPVRLEDVRGAAQDALIALAHDPLFSDAGAEGYVSTKREIEIGLERLEAMLVRIHA